MFNWININVITTVVRYILSFAGGYVLAAGWFDAASWESITTAIISLAAALWGAYESSRNKVVTDNGKTVVPLAALAPSTQATIETSVAAAAAK